MGPSALWQPQRGSNPCLHLERATSRVHLVTEFVTAAQRPCRGRPYPSDHPSAAYWMDKRMVIASLQPPVSGIQGRRKGRGRSRRCSDHASDSRIRMDTKMDTPVPRRGTHAHRHTGRRSELERAVATRSSRPRGAGATKVSAALVSSNEGQP